MRNKQQLKPNEFPEGFPYSYASPPSSLTSEHEIELWLRKALPQLSWNIFLTNYSSETLDKLDGEGILEDYICIEKRMPGRTAHVEVFLVYDPIT